MLVLETWSVTLGESLVKNACFGSLAGVSLLVNVSWNMLVWEACQVRVSSKSV